jgi:hypothetical protein
MADRAHNYKPTDTDRALEETRDRQISDDAGFEEPLDEGEEKLQDQVTTPYHDMHVIHVLTTTL